MVIKDGKTCYFSACKHYRPNDEFLYGEPLVNIVVREEDLEFQKLKQFSLETLESLSNGYPQNGVINIDFFIQEGTEELVLMEIASHPPGGLVSKMFDLYQGIQLQELHQKMQLGDSPEIRVKPPEEWKYSAYVIYPKLRGIVTDIKKPIFDSEAEVSWYIYPGQELQASSNMREVAIGILLSNDDFSVLQADCEAAQSKHFYTVSLHRSPED